VKGRKRYPELFLVLEEHNTAFLSTKPQPNKNLCYALGLQCYTPRVSSVDIIGNIASYLYASTETSGLTGFVSKRLCVSQRRGKIILKVTRKNNFLMQKKKNIFCLYT